MNRSEDTSVRNENNSQIINERLGFKYQLQIKGGAV